MIIGPDLQKSIKLFNKKKYSETIETLNSIIKYYSDSFVANKVLGFSFLIVGDYGSAFSYIENSIRKANSEKPDYDLVYAYALLKLRKGENQEAIKIMLDLLNKRKYTASIKNTLQAVKQSENKAVLQQFLNEEIEYVFNGLKIFIDVKEKKHKKRNKPLEYRFSDFQFVKKIIFFILIFFIIAISVFLIYKFFPRNNREFSDKISIEKSDLTSFSKNDYKIVLSDYEIFSSFNRAKKYFNQYDDNQAQREINRITNSNATIEVKDKATAFTRYFKEPDWRTLKTNYTIEEVLKTPYLYENCYVSWKGRIANLIYTDEKISFDFLVGYEDKKFIKATVKTEIDFSVLVYEDLPYEILSKIILDGEKFYLRSVSIHRLDEKN